MRFSYANFYIFFMNRASHFEVVGRMCYDSCIILNGLHLFVESGLDRMQLRFKIWLQLRRGDVEF